MSTAEVLGAFLTMQEYSPTITFAFIAIFQVSVCSAPCCMFQSMYPLQCELYDTEQTKYVFLGSQKRSKKETCRNAAHI